MNKLEAKKQPRRKKRSVDIFLTLGILLLFLTGIIIMFYPDIANWFAGRSHAGLIDQYQRTIDELPDEIIDLHFERARRYNNSLVGGLIDDPFIAGSGLVVPTDYYEILNINNTMGIIEIPAINVRVPIFHGVSDEVLMRGVGHISQTPFPIGQIGKHAVLTGHTGIPSSRLFTDLELLAIGDIFTISILNEHFVYQVDQKTVVLPHEISELRNIAGEDLVTLVTCTPYAINSHRLLVRGVRIHDEQEIENVVIETIITQSVKNWRVLFITGIAVLLILYWIFLLLMRIVKRRKHYSNNPQLHENQ